MNFTTIMSFFGIKNGDHNKDPLSDSNCDISQVKCNILAQMHETLTSDEKNNENKFAYQSYMAAKTSVNGTTEDFLNAIINHHNSASNSNDTEKCPQKWYSEVLFRVGLEAEASHTEGLCNTTAFLLATVAEKTPTGLRLLNTPKSLYFHSIIINVMKNIQYLLSLLWEEY